MQKDCSLFLARHSSNMNKFGLLTSSIKNSMRLSKVHESIPVESQISREDKSDVISPTSFI
jgi:hypothetical protein